MFLFLVDADSAALHDPKLATKWFQNYSGNKSSTRIFEVTPGDWFGGPQNSDAGILRWHKQQRITKVQIECDYSAAFLTTARNEIDVGSPGHLLASHGCCVMACRLK